MAKQTYEDIRKQIAVLEAKGAALKAEERLGVIGRIQEAIKVYGIEPNELYGGDAVQPKSKAKPESRPEPQSKPQFKTPSKSKSKFDLTPQFADGKGGEWVGRGPRPQWLRDALAAGQKLEDFAVNKTTIKDAGATKQTSKATGEKPTARKTSPARKATAQKPSAKSVLTRNTVLPTAASKNVVKAKYRDDAGNSWSGRGSQPKWLTTAIAGGKKREDFAV